MVWPLTGRERELAQIDAARKDPACPGVVLVAEAGVGKSRLAREAQAAASDAHVEWVQATRSAAAVPLAAFSGLVPDDTRADDLVGLIDRCAEAVRERAGRRPAVLVVDDAHLLDPVSAALVLHLVRTRSAFVIATVRAGEAAPDAIASLWKDAGARRIALEPLADDRVRALIEAALGDPVQEAALRWVTDVGQGNALYVRELVAGAIDAGALVHAPGFWRLNGTPPTSASLIELVGERLQALGEEQRAAVELVALGEPLTLDALATLTSEPALLDAEAAGLLALRGFEVGLAHPLYGEVIRTQLPPLRARSLRLRLADALGSDQPLRTARLKLDAGAALDPELALTAGRAANFAGDPDLGEQLAKIALAATDDLARADGLAEPARAATGDAPPNPARADGLASA
ncbi:AAA family ATPase, partial [Solirubrobacter phytolaccae]